ncbi:MAG: hypothetical protein SFY69_12225 [Planctomycetota bacterium]|nr:hypothetical protein [Planctomycetota bacterium]
MRPAVLASLATLAASGLAQAAFVSFASDTNPAGPTFRGFPVGAALGRLQDDAPVSVNFLVDLDEQGPGGPVSIPATFDFDATLNSYAYAGGVHVYNTSGYFQFNEAAGGGLILRVEWQNGAFTSLGPGPNALGPSGSVLSNSAADPSMVITTGGILGGIIASGRDNSFAFTLTDLFDLARNPVPVQNGGNIGAEFTAEGSFSGRVVPTPGALVLLGLGGLAIVRRRR